MNQETPIFERLSALKAAIPYDYVRDPIAGKRTVKDIDTAIEKIQSLEAECDALRDALKDALLQNPQQPLITDEHGVIRFKENPLVSYLLDKGGLNMKHLALFAHDNSNVTDSDQAQFAQLIGYSVSGWGSLSYVSPELAGEIDARAALANIDGES